MSAEKNVPEIRFDGFSAGWCESEFSGIATRVSTQHKSTCLPCVEYEDIVAGKGLFNKDIYQKKTFKAGLKFEIDDVVFGKLRPYLKNWFLADFEGIAVGDFWVLRADIVASTFLFSLIQTNKFEFISNLSAGSKMPRSDWGLVSSSCFFIPKNICESDKIGNTFQKLDSLINQHQQKHDKLSSIKKAMLEKMFPKQGETIPEIRFKGFSGEWEEKTLGELGETFTGLAGKTKHDFGHGQARFVTYMNVFANAISNENLVEPVEIDESQNEVVKGDVFFTTSSETPEEVGMSSIWMGEAKNVYLNSFCFGYRPKQKIDSVYLAYMLRASSFRKQVIFLAQGVSRYNISKTKVMDIKTYMPSLLEQEKIGSYFQNLDALINQHQQQITKLNNIKQACLSKMFV